MLFTEFYIPGWFSGKEPGYNTIASMIAAMAIPAPIIINGQYHHIIFICG